MLGGFKKGGKVDEATLISESWAQSEQDAREDGLMFSPLFHYHAAKNKGQIRHFNNETQRDKPLKYKASSFAMSVEVAPQPAPGLQVEDSEKTGSFNPHHRQAIKKFR